MNVPHLLPPLFCALAAALAAHADAPEARKRLREMASADSSEIIRATAAKHVAATSDTTAALPPLPGSPSLNPKAN